MFVETSKVNPSSDTHTQASPRHDILEVNSYLMSGLVVSSIDKWFMGPIPLFSLDELGTAGTTQQSLSTVMERAKLVVNGPEQVAWQHVGFVHDLSSIVQRLTPIDMI